MDRKGGAKGIRTPDLFHAIDGRRAESVRFEPAEDPPTYTQWHAVARWLVSRAVSSDLTLQNREHTAAPVLTYVLSGRDGLPPAAATEVAGQDGPATVASIPGAISG